MDRRTRAVIAAMEAAPCTMRALAREAGVSIALLSLIVSGQRAATSAVADAIAQALDRWGARCARAATTIRRANRTSTRRPR